VIDPKYPIGKFESRQSLSTEERRKSIDEIAATPRALREAVRGLDEKQLDTPYREGGWTIRQVVHHLPDSHLNAFIRLKFALTEDVPTIKPYDEAEWAKLPDVRETPIEVSLTLLESLHDRWVRLMRALDEKTFSREFRHPEHGAVTIDWLVAMYAWHGRHHTGHITTLRNTRGW
jgi:uncharacterized damage-inducible protein DinB